MANFGMMKERPAIIIISNAAKARNTINLFDVLQIAFGKKVQLLPSWHTKL